MTSRESSLPSTLSRKLLGMVVAAAIVLIVSYAINPQRTWPALLVSAYFMLTLGLGGAAFMAMTKVCGAGWSVAFRRVPEALTGLLPFAGIILLGVLTLRLSAYSWHHHGDSGAGTFWFKEFWLQPTFWMARAVVFVLIWVAMSRILVSQSRRQDTLPSSTARSSSMMSVLFLALFAITISLAGVDWIMALEPMWFSTMWGVYHFSGLMMGTLAAIVIACILLRRAGVLEGVFREEHLHDLGKLLLGFSCFWIYIWFSQYMLIWYANMPEETSYFLIRTQGPWAPVVVFSLVLNWGIPFFVLLPRPCKRSESMMLRVAAVVLLGRWVDLSVMIYPPSLAGGPVIGVPELAAIVGLISLSAILFTRAFRSAPTVPLKDPYLSESLHYHN